MLAFENFFESANGVFNLHVFPGRTRELLGHEEGLGEESLYATSAAHSLSPRAMRSLRPAAVRAYYNLEELWSKAQAARPKLAKPLE